MNPLGSIFQAIKDYFQSLSTPTMSDSNLTLLRGDGSWPWSARVDGDDIIVTDVIATCFGGSNDPQDNGETASGISTKGNPTLKACALPMIYTGNSAALRKALGGSPIPKLPWKTMVEIIANGKRLTVPVIDLGPAKKTGNAIDLTLAAARFFDGNATASNFEIECSYRILGGAKYLTGKGSYL